jgi:hypothetical protein
MSRRPAGISAQQWKKEIHRLPVTTGNIARQTRKKSPENFAI